MNRIRNFKITKAKILAMTLFVISAIFACFLVFKNNSQKPSNNSSNKKKKEINIEDLKNIETEFDSVKTQKIEIPQYIENLKNNMKLEFDSVKIEKIEMPSYVLSDILISPYKLEKTVQPTSDYVLEIAPPRKRDLDASFRKHTDLFRHCSFNDQYSDFRMDNYQKFEAEQNATRKHLAESYYRNIYSKVKQADKEDRFDLALYDKARRNSILSFLPDKHEKYKAIIKKWERQLSDIVERCLMIYHPYPTEIAAMVNSYLNADDRINFSCMIKARYRELKTKDNDNNQKNRLSTDDMQMTENRSVINL